MSMPEGPAGPLEATHADAVATARLALAQTRSALEATREQRDRLNDQIRVMSAEADTLAAVVGAFDRRAKIEAQAAKPVRRKRSTSSEATP